MPSDPLVDISIYKSQDNDEIEIAIPWNAHIKYNIPNSIDSTAILSNQLCHNFYNKIKEKAPNLNEEQIITMVNDAYRYYNAETYSLPSVLENNTPIGAEGTQNIHRYTTMKLYNWCGKFSFIEEMTYPLTILDGVTNSSSNDTSSLFTIDINIQPKIWINPVPTQPEATYTPVFIVNE